MARKPNTRRKVYGAKLHGRSRITNGSTLLPTIDGRSLWARRFRDLISLHESDIAPDGAISTAKKSIIRRAATLSIELEHLEMRFASSEASAADLLLYSRLANTLRRLLESVGIERQMHDVTPSIDEYLASQGLKRGEVMEVE